MILNRLPATSSDGNEDNPEYDLDPEGLSEERYENLVNSDMFIGSEDWTRADAVSVLLNLVIGATYIRTIDGDTGEEINRGYVHILSGAYLQKVRFVVAGSIDDDPFQPNEMISLRRGNMYDAVMEKLNDRDLGIKVERPLEDGSDKYLHCVIHTGRVVDGSNVTVFSSKRGHFKDPVYFWNDEWYNRYLFVGKNVGIVGENGKPDGFGLEHRMFFHEDTSYGELDKRERMVIGLGDGVPWLRRHVDRRISNNTVRAMDDRGRAISRRQLPQIIVTFDIDPNSDHPIFKEDYDVGDMVLAVGDFGVNHFMRVIEHTITVDKDGIVETPVFGEPVMIEPGSGIGGTA